MRKIIAKQNGVQKNSLGNIWYKKNLKYFVSQDFLTLIISFLTISSVYASKFPLTLPPKKLHFICIHVDGLKQNVLCRFKNNFLCKRVLDISQFNAFQTYIYSKFPLTLPPKYLRFICIQYGWTKNFFYVDVFWTLIFHISNISIRFMLLQKNHKMR